MWKLIRYYASEVDEIFTYGTQQERDDALILMSDESSWNPEVTYGVNDKEDR